VLYKLGRLHEATAQLERARHLAGDDPTILDHLGDVYAARGMTREASEAWTRAVRAGADASPIQRKLDALAHP
jgi:predicted negative regulator of RcsB-dependent stress response